MDALGRDVHIETSYPVLQLNRIFYITTLSEYKEKFLFTCETLAQVARGDCGVSLEILKSCLDMVLGNLF